MLTFHVLMHDGNVVVIFTLERNQKEEPDCFDVSCFDAFKKPQMENCVH